MFEVIICLFSSVGTWFGLSALGLWSVLKSQLKRNSNLRAWFRNLHGRATQVDDGNSHTLVLESLKNEFVMLQNKLNCKLAEYRYKLKHIDQRINGNRAI